MKLWPFNRKQRREEKEQKATEEADVQRHHAEDRWKEEETERLTLEEVRRRLAEADDIQLELEARSRGLRDSEAIRKRKPREV